MKLIIVSQAFLGFASLILGSPLSPSTSLHPRTLQGNFQCPPADLDICTVEILVNSKDTKFTVRIYDSQCNAMCVGDSSVRDTKIGWSSDCLKGKSMVIQVDSSGEVHPIFYNANQIDIGIVPDGNKDVVTHRSPFPCPKASPAPVATSSTPKATPTATAPTPCQFRDDPPPVGDECYIPWREVHNLPVGSGHTGQGS